jgi:hypothetical protein
LKKRECKQQKERWRIFYIKKNWIEKKKLERERTNNEEGEEE